MPPHPRAHCPGLVRLLLLLRETGVGDFPLVLGRCVLRGVEDEVNIILVSDHGMLSTCGERTVYLADLAPHVSGFDKSWVTFDSSFVGFLPPPDVDVAAAYREMQRALGLMRNGEQLSLWRKEDLPPRFLLSSSARIPVSTTTPSTAPEHLQETLLPCPLL